MSAQKYLTYLQEKIHSTVFATVDENGLPQTCVIDIMLSDENGLYFLTATGKKFYDRLIQNNFVAITGLTGEDTLSTISITLRGKVRDIGPELVETIFEKNPYMKEIYPQEDSRKVLTVFQMYEGEGEFFDLTSVPPTRQSFSFGGKEITKMGYEITDACIGCSKCTLNCPANCIEVGKPYHIRQENCIRCGNCFEACPVGAILKF